MLALGQITAGLRPTWPVVATSQLWFRPAGLKVRSLCIPCLLFVVVVVDFTSVRPSIHLCHDVMLKTGYLVWQTDEKPTTETKDLPNHRDTKSKQNINTLRNIQRESTNTTVTQIKRMMFRTNLLPALMLMMTTTWLTQQQVTCFSTTSITTPAHTLQQRTTTRPLSMVPKYVGNKWIPQTEDDMPSAGYDVLGTFVRHGPKPTITRLVSPDDYEQAILKFMVTDQCDYITAQGNMDAYLRNPPDWQYQRLEDVKNGYEKQRDYVTIQTSDVILVVTWSAIVFAVVGRLLYSITNGVDFVRNVYMYVCVSFSFSFRAYCAFYCSCGIVLTQWFRTCAFC